MAGQSFVEGNVRQWVTDGTPESVIRRYEKLAVAAESSDYGDLDTDVVVIDTETTGFSFTHDELTQIAAARLSHGKVTDWFVTFVNPGKPIPEDVSHLTNITDEDVMSAPSPNDALSDLVVFVGSSKLVAHNADFDRTFTTRHPAGYALLQNVWIDSLDLARIALPRLKSHRLLDLVRAFGAPLSTHRADDDVAATCSVFRILLAAVDAMPKELVAQISDMATLEEWPTKVVFDHFSCSRSSNKDAQTNDASSALEALGNRSKHADASEEVSDHSTQVTSTESSKETEMPKKPSPDVSRETSGRWFSLRSSRRSWRPEKDETAKVDADMVVADPQRNLVFPSEENIAAAFSQAGMVGRMYTSYEQRSEQVAMAEAVRSAFKSSRNLIVEAGTGVGKSMAYLIPSVLTAKANNVTVGVATKTNALLDQLVYHELPQLKESMSEDHPEWRKLSYAALKGFSHYLCLRKVERLARTGASMKEVAGKEKSQAPAIAGVLSYIDQTDYDDFDSLKVDYRLVPRGAISTTSRDCLRRKCPYFGRSCYVHGARRKAERADIVVTNHSLLFCDVAADGGLLPPIRYWIVDEAHGAENEARKAFSLKLDAEEITRLANKVSSAGGSSNVFARAERRIASKENEDPTLFYTLLNKARSAGELYATPALEFCSELKQLLFFDEKKSNKGYEMIDLWINQDIRNSSVFASIRSVGHLMMEKAEQVIKASQDIVAYLEGIEEAAESQREIASVAMDLKDQLNAAELILNDSSQNYAYAAKLCRRKHKTGETLEALPLNIGSIMNETLYERTHSIVFASATISVSGSFGAFERSMGLNESEASGCDAIELQSHYDYDTQMVIYVVEDMPDPNEPSYLKSLIDLLIGVHLAQHGSMLTLFTNRKEMERSFDAVEPKLKEADLRLVCQKWGVSVKGLRDDFLSDERLSLFALKSFWEGFDAPGSTLRGVVIPKLPFSKPSDPLSRERSTRDAQAWSHYVLPQAILETKQAAGRLIRKSTDSGCLILADHRIISKGYGKSFLRSMPSRNIKVMKAKDIIEQIAKANQR